jgi:hypothetical protein
MHPLIDGDILAYEIGFAAEAGWQQEGLPHFDYVADLLDMRITNICGAVEATQPPTLFLTGKSNFRDQIATRQPYKMRNGVKPFHYYNIRAYLKGMYDWRLTEGLEADDLMALAQTGNTIICTRDKDLRAVSGWHYGWELGNQPSFGPENVETFGYLKLSSDRKSIKGTGMVFFYSQCITGDRVDSVLGLDGYGPVKAFEILNGCTDTLDAFNRVREAYRGLYGDRGDEYLLESGRLLWMTRELNEDGSPVLWEFPIEE